MAEIVRMPKLSDTMTEGVVAEWHKKVGEKVNTGELLAEIETDKATMEFESFQEGYLLHIGVEEGKGAPVDSILAILGDKNEDVKGILDAEIAMIKESKKEQTPEIEEIKKKDSPQTIISENTDSVKTDTKNKAKPEFKSSFEDVSGRLKASPLAKKLAEERGLDLNWIVGTGDDGRIIKSDVESFQTSANSNSILKEKHEDTPVSQMRKTIARRLGESKFSAPHFYLTMDINMEDAMAARTSINKSIEPSKISVNDLVVKAVATALRTHPAVNSSWHGDFIRTNSHIHVGVAVSVDEGLLVPVVRFADSLTLTQIGTQVRAFAEKARTKKLKPEDWEGNTFTISNLGMFGIEEFTAIVNPPDSCIMAVGAVREEPVVINGTIAVGKRMKVTLSCDHRIVDGVTGSKFLQTFKNLMENPIILLGNASI